MSRTDRNRPLADILAEAHAADVWRPGEVVMLSLHDNCQKVPGLIHRDGAFGIVNENTTKGVWPTMLPEEIQKQFPLSLHFQEGEDPGVLMLSFQSVNQVEPLLQKLQETDRACDRGDMSGAEWDRTMDEIAKSAGLITSRIINRGICPEDPDAITEPGILEMGAY